MSAAPTIIKIGRRGTMTYTVSTYFGAGRFQAVFHEYAVTPETGRTVMLNEKVYTTEQGAIAAWQSAMLHAS